MLNVIIVVLLIILLILPPILQYIYNWHISFNKSYGISVYGLYLLVYTVIQFIFSILNNVRWKVLDNKRNGTLVKKTNLMVVGHREDVEYYKMCLESINTTSTNVLNLNKIYIMIDGDTDQDEYMINLVHDTFDSTNKKVFYLHLNDFNVSEEVMIIYLDQFYRHFQRVLPDDLLCAAREGSRRFRP